MEKRSSDGKRKRDAVADRAVKGKKTYSAPVGEKRGNPRPVPGRPVPSKNTAEKKSQPPSSAKTVNKSKPVNKARTDNKSKTVNKNRIESKPKNTKSGASAESSSVRLVSKKRRSSVHRTNQEDAIDREKRILSQNESDDSEYIETKTAEPPKKPLSPYVRKLKRVLLAMLAIIIILGVFTILAFTVFFKIDNITVEGKSRYKSDEIISASQINLGDNLLLYNTSPAAENIMNKFPYIETVDIEKKLFNSINIKVTEAKPFSIVKDSGKYVVLSKNGKIIEINDKKTYDVPTIIGAKLKNVTLSSKVDYKNENLKKYLDKVLDAINENNMIKDVSTVDISNTSGIFILKKDGFKIIVGNFENVDYKLKTASYIIKNNVREGAKGTLDVSLVSAESGKSYLHLGEDLDDESSVQENSKTSQNSKASSEQNSSNESNENNERNEEGNSDSEETGTEDEE